MSGARCNGSSIATASHASWSIRLSIRPTVRVRETAASAAEKKSNRRTWRHRCEKQRAWPIVECPATVVADAVGRWLNSCSDLSHSREKKAPLCLPDSRSKCRSAGFFEPRRKFLQESRRRALQHYTPLHGSNLVKRYELTWHPSMWQMNEEMTGLVD